MRKYFIFRLILALCLAGVVAPARADNSIRMVTYFPVPYAAYNNLFINSKGQFKVGTRLNGSFILNVGSDSSESLAANTIELNNSTLRFDVDLATLAASFGINGGHNNDVALRFENVRIASLNSSLDKPIKVLSANSSLDVGGKTFLFEKFFDGSTDAAALPGCNGTVMWKQLTVAGNTGYFLVCDSSPAPEGLCPSKKNKVKEIKRVKIECSIALTTENVTKYCTKLNDSTNPLTGMPDPIMNFSTCSVMASIPFTWSTSKGYTWFESSDDGECASFYESPSQEWEGDKVCVEVLGSTLGTSLWKLPKCDSQNEWENIDKVGVWYPSKRTGNTPGFRVYTVTCADEE